MDRSPTVYILVGGKHGTLYVGVTSDLAKRLHEHREGLIKAFTSRYGITRLVHFKIFDEMLPAITREKQIKKWRRDWKLNLIEAGNPAWVDVAVGLGLIRPAAPEAMDPRLRGDDEVSDE